MSAGKEGLPLDTGDLVDAKSTVVIGGGGRRLSGAQRAAIAAALLATGAGLASVVPTVTTRRTSAAHPNFAAPYRGDPERLAKAREREAWNRAIDEKKAAKRRAKGKP